MDILCETQKTSLELNPSEHRKRKQRKTDYITLKSTRGKKIYLPTHTLPGLNKFIPFPGEPKNHETSPHLQTILETQKSTLFEISPPYDNLVKELSEKIDKDSYISLPNQIFKQIADTLPENIAKIDSQTKYLSLKKLEEFEQKSHFRKWV